MTTPREILRDRRDTIFKENRLPKEKLNGEKTERKETIESLRYTRCHLVSRITWIHSFASRNRELCHSQRINPLLAFRARERGREGGRKKWPYPRINPLSFFLFGNESRTDRCETNAKLSARSRLSRR